MSSILKFGSILLYSLTFIIILWRAHQLSDGEKANNRSLFLFLWFVACILHAAYLYPQTFTPQGLNLGFYNTVSIVLFIIATLILMLSTLRKIEFIGLIILPLVVASIILTILSPTITTSSSNLHGLQIHIVSSLFAFSVLSISAVQSILLFVQDKRIRKHNLSGLTQALPPLHDTEKFLFQTITAGFVLLTLALASGFMFLENMFEQHIAHKTILSIIAWFVFALLLLGRWKFGWRGKLAMRWTLGGFVFLILAYLGSKFVQELILHRVASLPIS